MTFGRDPDHMHDTKNIEISQTYPGGGMHSIAAL